METIKDFVFQVDSDLVKKYYAESENIKIIDDELNQKSNRCVIYFSSNELYYPNTEKAFLNTIVSRDKYEWINNKFPNSNRHIFVRDIQKQWYIEGTCSKYNTPALVAEYLNELSKGYMVYTIGSSAGGYAALLFGSLINANRVYAFNSQFNLNVIIKNSQPFVDPILFRYQKDETRSKFYRISNFLNTNSAYFYFQSANSKIDKEQFDSCSKNHLLHKIEFKTSNHGFPFLRHNLLYVLNLSEYGLMQLVKFKMHPILFSIKIDGLFIALSFIGNAILKRLKKKWITEKKLS